TKKPGVALMLYHKILLIMRLTTVIIIASLMQVSAATFGQRISLDKQNATLKSVLTEIRKQSGYDFYYDGRNLGADLRVTVSVKDATIDEAVGMVLRDLPLIFEIKDKAILIK